jgi:REP element-mobilizing transposase RayT
MPRRKRNVEPHTLQHVIQRGNNRNYIYEDNRDKKEFLTLLETAVSTYEATLLQYVLMDNHYHLLLKVGEKPLSSLVWFLNRSYTLYYNQRYHRIGTIYGGRYKNYLITEDQKFYSIVRYIVQNPVKAGLVGSPAEYRYSGHAAVLKHEDGLVDRAMLLGYFSPDAKVALARYRQCTEHENWSPQVGFATIIDRKVETEERLAFLLDRLLFEKHQTDKRTMLVAGSASPIIRDLRTEFVQLAIADGHALKDIASFLHVSHETVRRIGITGTAHPLPEHR